MVVDTKDYGWSGYGAAMGSREFVEGVGIFRKGHVRWPSTSWPVAPRLQRSRIEREAQRGKGAARLQGQDLQMTLFPVLDDARIRGGERHVENLRRGHDDPVGGVAVNISRQTRSLQRSLGIQRQESKPQEG
jgi:hypothetical protein